MKTKKDLSSLMLRYFVWSIPLLCAAQSGWAEDLASFRSTFERSIYDITTTHRQRLDQLGQSYLEDLQKIQRDHLESGEREKAKVVSDLIASFKNDHSAPSTEGLFPAARQIAVDFQENVATLKMEKAKKVVTLASQYHNALLRLQKELESAGRTDEIAAIQAEIERLEGAEIVLTAKSLVLGTSEDKVAVPKNKSIPKESTEPDVPRELTGRFFVSVDDAATIYLNGNLLHTAPLNESVSPEVTLKLGDCIVVKLENKPIGRNVPVAFVDRRFQLAFMATNGSNGVNFRAAEFRVLEDGEKLVFTPQEFGALEVKAVRDLRIDRRVMPFPTNSEWVWGKSDTAWLVAVVTPEMVAKHKPNRRMGTNRR